MISEADKVFTLLSIDTIQAKSWNLGSYRKRTNRMVWLQETNGLTIGCL